MAAAAFPGSELHTVKERGSGREPGEREKARRELRCLSPAAVKAEERGV